ncbi:MAG: DEAD/DEAH box helicase [Deltaproteobacteria bacterium]|nr:DEAD/DEAH box helicase [Deltaproteobacteria bacterium]
MDVLQSFHPAVRSWFEGRFPDGPTPPQEQGWPLIAQGEDVLISAPTGSGKTLSAFLVCIDRFYHAAARRAGGVDGVDGVDGVEGAEAGGLPLFGGEPESSCGAVAEAEPARPPGVEVLYISPLKALAADIWENLQQPLQEIAGEAARMGLFVPELRVAVRSGDTPNSQRAAMVRRPPQILVTTPESLFMLLTARRSREILRDVRTVIVDEIHAVARDKRGSHLATSLERLDALCHRRPARIGLSATQRPLETVARLLVGSAPGRSHRDGSARCRIVDEGHRRALDLAIELPDEDLEAVASGEQMGAVLDRIAVLVKEHHTTLVFVNTRRLAERLAHELAERLGERAVAAHHGSLSKDRRLRVERLLRAGELSALVATASLELGIDIGPVELVCQIGSPRGLSTFLQRVGRSGHSRAGTPKGRLYPTSRDELVECVALLRGVRAGHLDAIHPPVSPLDILAQQIVAACASEDWPADDLFALMLGAAPFAKLSRADFDAVVEMLAEGITTGRGRRAAYLHFDRVNGILRARRGARLAAITSGGAIPEIADYRVIADPSETFVGTVFEDFAIESMPGDIFLLGSTSWRIRRVESGVVRVVDAGGAPPSIPFWQGEAPARSEELSDEVSALRRAVAQALDEGGQDAAVRWLCDECELPASVAEQLARYLGASYTALGVLPTRDDIVFERFFDESGGMQLVIHAPLGARINRAYCLALRKKFCKSFNFELQAAANDDAMVLSLGPHHSFPLDAVVRYVASATALHTLEQAALASPMFTARWRWNLNRSLAVLRWKSGKRNPPPIQRMEADDMMAAVFPNQAACQENVSYPIEIPDHPLVRQTMHDCLTEAMDVDGLIRLVKGLEDGRIRAHFIDASEASPLSHEILNGRPFTFLDDAPLEERRTRAVALPRGLPVESRELARLDPEAIERVRGEVLPDPDGIEELHDLLQRGVVWPPIEARRADFETLVHERRALALRIGARALWCAVERRPALEALYRDPQFEPDTPCPPALVPKAAIDSGAALADLLRGQLDALGPVTLVELAARTGLATTDLEAGIAALETQGFVLRGRFEADDSGAAQEQVCARRLLTRIHSYTRDRLRREIEPVSAQDFIRFLLRWQHTAPGTQGEGRGGVAHVVEQLQGFELPAGAWEESVLRARLDDYRPEWLDAVCLSGEVIWGRLSPRAEAAGAAGGSGDAADDSGGSSGVRGGSVPSRATRLTLALRADLPWLLQAHRGGADPEDPGAGAASDVLACLRSEGALFHTDLAARLGRLPVEIEEGLWGLVSRGHVTADGFQAIRSLLGARERWARTRARERARRGLRRGLRDGPGGAAEGRWSLLPCVASVDDVDALAEATAEQLLMRWGVVFRDLLARERLAIPWRDLIWAMRRLEARGVIRGGRFVSGFTGEQFALPGAVDALRRVRRMECSGEVVRLSGADPLNLVGILTPGPRIPALRTNRVVYRDGLPVTEEDLLRSSEPIIPGSV